MATVQVVLIDANTQRVLGEVALEAAQLPASFATPTTLHLGGADWQVVQASSTTRDEYVALGKLVLQLRRVEQVDPRTILFSLPTIENVAPPTTHDAVPDDAVSMHEDDWRQVELVSSRFAAEIAAEQADVCAIFAAHRRGAAFAKLHVRQRIPAPLAGTAIRFDELAGLGAHRALAIGPGGAPPARIDGGFAFVTPSGAIYGQEVAGYVVALGLTAGTDPAPIQPLARSHGLTLVSWCGVE